MCDYSLELVASRPAKVGDKLISAGFHHTITRGFASVDDTKVAVCLLPGTELAFEDEVKCETGFIMSRTLGHKVASQPRKCPVAGKRAGPGTEATRSAARGFSWGE